MKDVIKGTEILSSIKYADLEYPEFDEIEKIHWKDMTLSPVKLVRGGFYKFKKKLWIHESNLIKLQLLVTAHSGTARARR